VDPDITWRAAEGAIDDAGELRGPGGKIVSGREYLDRAAALDAVGLKG
jgi:hypothetical protein